MMNKFLCTVALLLVCVSGSFAQAILTRTGSYTYVMPGDQSLDAAKQTALELAKLKVLEAEFGSVVGVRNLSSASNVAGETFLSIGETEVKGEWISTVGEPEYKIVSKDGRLYIEVTVTGKIRKITSSKIDLDVRVLSNGTDDKNRTDVLRDGDGLFILFKSPVKGYVAVYQSDSDGVFRLLPYANSDLGSMPVKGGREYVFFEQDFEGGVALREELAAKKKVFSNYNIVCEKTRDLCRYYVVFSPNSFIIANDDVADKGIPAQLTFEAFQKWLTKAMKQDKDMVSLTRDVVLEK